MDNCCFRMEPCDQEQIWRFPGEPEALGDVLSFL
jgi:hypothetical protein